jgi:alpha-glucosidase
LSGFHLPFNFHLIRTPWNARAIAGLIDEYEAALPTGGWPNWVLGNHDKPRLATRLGGLAQARLAALLLLTLRGTPTLYNGDEIGMVDGVIHPHEVQDPWEKNAPGLGLGRDPCRTPMQWSRAAAAGFTQGQPWLPVGDNAFGCNVLTQTADPRSLLSFYRQLIELRQREASLALGGYRLLDVTDHTLIYERRSGERGLIVALNFSAETQPVSLSDGGQVLLSTHSDLHGNTPGRVASLAPHEGVVVV